MTNASRRKQSWHHILLNLSLADIHNFNPTLSLSVLLLQDTVIRRLRHLCVYSYYSFALTQPFTLANAAGRADASVPPA
ncbi:hypothetical protein BZP36_10730 [Raoultella terrigena]|nr:hypothetical protein BZP36_10730 [Raoultella terrigena]